MAVGRVRVNEQSSKTVEFDILDENDLGVSYGSLTAGTVTLLDLETFVAGSPPEGTINNRDLQNCLNTNGVTIDANGHVIWTMDPEDNVIVNPRRQIERHRAMFDFTWNGGSFAFEFEVEVVNLRRAL